MMCKKLIPVFVFFIIVCIVLFAQDAMTVLAENGNVGIGTEHPTANRRIGGNGKAKIPVKYNSGETVKVTRDIPEDLCPVGSIQPYGGVSDPPGWMICDGRELNRDDYPELFGVIGYNFTAAGTTTFNIPDLRDKFVSGTLQNENPGMAGGNNLLTLTAGQMPVHSHGVDIAAVPGHTHSYIDTYRIGSDEINGSGSKWVAENEVENSNKTTGTAGEHSHSISIHNAGGGQPFDNRPAFVKLNFIIKY